MKITTCRKCKSTRIKIESEGSCDNCENNGFYLDEEFAASLGVKAKEFDNEYFYDQKLREEAEAILGHGVERCEAHDGGSCKMGELGGDGCWIFSCHDCGGHIEMIPRATC